MRRIPSGRLGARSFGKQRRDLSPRGLQCEKAKSRKPRISIGCRKMSVGHRPPTANKVLALVCAAPSQPAHTARRRTSIRSATTVSLKARSDLPSLFSSITIYNRDTLPIYCQMHALFRIQILSKGSFSLEYVFVRMRRHFNFINYMLLSRSLYIAIAWRIA
jgi:hypothetical protein